MSDVLTLARGLLVSVLKDAAHAVVKSLLIHAKKRTAPTGSSDGSPDIVE